MEVLLEPLMQIAHSRL